MDFLSQGSSLLLNLVPDKEGVITIPLVDLGSHPMIQIVAVDPVSTTSRTLSLPEQAVNFQDLRFKKGLDPAKHFTQQKQVSILNEGSILKIEDLSGSRFESYDSLAKVFNLYATLSRNTHLQEFSFLTQWPKLPLQEKKALYSKHASHELNFFLFKKDPGFFKENVLPFLANKKDKTFMDHWLLDMPLDSYLEPWNYELLNVVERVLLAQKIKDQDIKTQRHLNDMFKLMPVNLERLVMLFDTSIKGDELNGKDHYGMWGEKARLNLQSKFNAMDPTGKNALGLEDRSKTPKRPAVTQENGPAGPQSETKPSQDSLKLGAIKESSRALSKNFKDGKGKSDGELKESLSADGIIASDKATFYYRERLGEVDQKQKQLYMKIDPTMEWAENNYYNLPKQAQIGNLVGVNSFWKDYSFHTRGLPFLNRHFPEASRNFTEMMFALSVLDLPFASGKHAVKFEANTMEFKPAGPVIAFHEEVRLAEPQKDQVNILVSQNFYRQGDRYQEENGEKLDKFLRGEFVVHTVYGCQVVVTNPTSVKQKLTVLLQLPVGSIPLNNTQITSSILVNLEPYRTQTMDYYFYFPKAGKFNHFPVHIAKNEKYVTSPNPMVFNVVESPTTIDTSSWDHVSQQGTNQDVLGFLERENVRSLNLSKIAFRLKDKIFFENVLKLLDSRHLFNAELWSYGIFHGHVSAIRQYLLHADKIIAECGGPIDCKILTHDPISRAQYEHLEYKPLVNARAHSLGHARQIVNNPFLEQYHRFLKIHSYYSKLDDSAFLSATYYLLLQDRIDEALEFFNRVDALKIATTLQYDYCKAYLAFYKQDYQGARDIAQKHLNHPVDRWKNTFTTILAQLDEVDGKGPKVVDPDNKEQKQALLAAGEPSFDFNVDAGKINLNWQNLDSVKVNYYLMDVELLFSRNPFVQQSGNQFAFIKPNASQVLALPKGQSKSAFTIPQVFSQKNLLVEISGGAKSIALPYYANAMSVQLIENYGQIKVLDNGTSKPLSKVYIKVYSRTSQGVKFHKDGYTDVRGRFDYATVSTPEKTPIEKFSVLILSEQHGAIIREANPPQQ